MSPRLPPTRPAATESLADLMLALGVSGGARFSEDDLRYERIIIMNDADVDGAHDSFAADHLLLPHHAGPDPRRSPLLALPPLYG